MSKLAHSNQETMDEIEAHARGELWFTDVMSFGKHKGKTIKEVLEKHTHDI